MRTQAGLHIDPGALAAGPGARELEVVVPYTMGVGRGDAAAGRGAGGGAQCPRPAGSGALGAIRSVIRLPGGGACASGGTTGRLASRCQFPVEPQVVMARGWVEGFQYALHPDSTVLVGTRKHFGARGKKAWRATWLAAGTTSH